jgi:hypothetical protein
MGHEVVRPSLVLASLISITLAACGDDGHDHDHDIDAPVVQNDGGNDGVLAPRETITRNFQLTGGGVSEPEFRLNAQGDTIVVRATCDATTLAWNVHTHDAGETQILEEESGVDSIDYTITGPPNDYWLLLVNGTGTITCDLTIELWGTASYTSGLPE